MKTNTSTKLHILIGIFIFGFLSLFSLNQVFTGLVNDLDKKTKNYETKIQLGEYIAEDILKIKALFFELATTTTSKRSRQIVKNKINDVMADIDLSLNILENGGTLHRHIKLNVEGHANTIKITNYKPNKKELLPLEVIDIRPKLLELKNMIQKVDSLLSLRTEFRKINDIQKFSELSKNLRRFYKTTPAFFTRMSENIRRLLYEGDIELNNINITIQKQKSKYMQIKMGLIFLVILIVLLIGYWISKIINKDNDALIDLNNELKAKEDSIRAILDAQPNIIVISDGTKMVDANKMLIDFFDEYDSFKDFQKINSCICDFFETEIPNDGYIIKKDYNGLSWVEHILKNPQISFRVIMKKGSTNHHFSILANKRIINELTKEVVIIVTLNDITDEVNSQINLKSLNDNLELIIENKTKELLDLNESLEQKVIIETQKVRDKDKQITQQARFAALGEMIGNIAHQWRQPLSAINTTASGMQLQMQLGLTNDEEISDSYSRIMRYVDFLTQTIEDFRGFFKEDKEEIDFNIIDVMKKTLSITSATYKDTNINLILACDDEKLIANGMPSELSQVFLNILNNAKDALCDNDIKEKFVHIRSEIKDGFNIMYIQDNAGGIPNDIIDKIFDPYFTTKHQSQGTGIGLYMSKDIIEKHMNGLLSIKNTNTTLDGQAYNGACFKIAIPIKSN
ncbi:MAG: HAMP domain-containing histidine kinase [Arcobacteraceae bacterium]|nr:HAMP domain-containing histidine kinase [Arcobacteraceae bacterium]